MDANTLFLLAFFASICTMFTAILRLIFGPSPLRAAAWLTPIGLAVALGWWWAAPKAKTYIEYSGLHVACHHDYTKCTWQEQLVTKYKRIEEARADCVEVAKKLARYGDAQFPDMPFQGYLPNEKSVDTGKLSLIENDARYQNGFGAWQHVTLTCLYDLDAREVVEVTSAAE
ncbi:Uncharacterised protein [Starkeya nomas]|uniref:Uncharacterized protein n=1 Tax=Starkeya nomas TaxID=2666134 RepID=A0A5S9Q3Y3_9HYPH|nr:hypothetical protein [Starkeya nomas]CAA0112396.1 Uncharacterised protein [Starkeya nomas]